MSDKRVPVIESEDGHAAVIEFTNENGEIETRHIPWTPPKHSPNRPGSGETHAKTVKRAHRAEGAHMPLKAWAKNAAASHRSSKVKDAAMRWLSNK